MSDLPTGTVTFLFTDIEGSTRFWEQQPEAMHVALGRHNALLHAAIEQQGGHVFKTMGDGFCAAFAYAAEAVRAALHAQRSLRAAKQPLRVRMAIHTGAAIYQDGDYFGAALSRVARLLATGHGGQVLLSAATAAQLPPELLAEVEMRSLGVHRLRDLTAREAIFQLLAPGLPAKFPPLNTLDIAFRRGVRRAAAIAGVVLAVVSGLAATAVWQSHRAARERARAERQASINRRERYAAEMNLAGQALEAGYLSRVSALVDRQRPGPSEEDLRGFAWRYLLRACQGEQRFTLTDRTGNVHALAISPDGTLLATGGDDRVVQLWALPKMGPQRPLSALPAPRVVATLPEGDAISAIAFSPNGQILAAGASSGPVKLWSVTARRQTAALRGGTLQDGGLAFSPDGKALAVGSGPVVRLWDLATRRVIATTPRQGQASQTTAVAFSPDGRTLAYASMDHPVSAKLWDVPTRRVVATLLGHVGFVFSLAFSPDGKILATGSGDNSVRLWDVAARRTVGVMNGLAGTAGGLAFSPDGKSLATGSGDGVIRVWDVPGLGPQHPHPPSVGTRAGTRSSTPPAQRQVRRLRGHLAGVGSLAFTPGGQMLVSSGGDHTVRLWNLTPAPDSDVLRGHRQWIWHMAFSPDGKSLASAGGFDRTVRLWDVATGRLIRSRQIVAHPEDPGGVGAAAFSPDGRYLAFCGSPPEIQLWDARLKHRIGLFKGHSVGVPYITFSPKGKLLASCGRDNTVRLWEVASRKEVRRLPEGIDIGIGAALAFSPDGERLVVMGPPRTLLWDLGSGRLTPLFPGDPVGDGLALSPDGRAVVAGGWDGQLRWWDLTRGRVTAAVPAHAGDVAGVAFSPDGREVATAGYDSIVRIWDPQTRQEILTLKGSGAPLHCVAFSPDGNTLACAGADSTVRLWRAAPSERTGARPRSSPS